MSDAPELSQNEADAKPDEAPPKKKPGRPVGAKTKKKKGIPIELLPLLTPTPTVEEPKFDDDDIFTIEDYRWVTNNIINDSDPPDGPKTILLNILKRSDQKFVEMYEKKLAKANSDVTQQRIKQDAARKTEDIDLYIRLTLNSAS